MNFRVWAPRPAAVELEAEDRRVPMSPAGDGWWSVDVPDAGPSTDYAFRVDGGEPVPDPRSPWQPSGVHRPSRVVDHSAYAWQDGGWRGTPWSPSSVVYEMHVGTFTPEGTFDAAAARLDHLRELGVTHVELMPVAAFPGRRGWGYDGVALFAPQDAYGGPGGLKRFVDACHSRRLAVLLDVVYNHLGPSGNYLGRFGPYFTDRYVTPWGAAVNLDGRDSDEVRRFVLDNALGWLRDYHFDGLRLDAVHAFLDTSAVHLLEELAVEVEALASRLERPLVLVAESNRNDPRLVRSRSEGGYALSAVWSDDVHHSIHAVLTGERDGYYVDFGRLADLAKALRDAYVFDGRHSLYRGRRHGRPAAGVRRGRFVACLQNHDQVGNRARGERIGTIAGPARQKIGAALLLTAPFVPLLFQGEEWAASAPFLYFTDHDDAELGRAVSEGRRREFATFGWAPDEVPDPQAEETFRRSRLDWSEAAREPHAGVLDWYRRLIRLRRENADLLDDRPESTEVRFDEDARWLVVRRGRIRVAVNLGARAQDVPVGTPARVLAATADLSGTVPASPRMGPDTVAVLES